MENNKRRIIKTLKRENKFKENNKNIQEGNNKRRIIKTFKMENNKRRINKKTKYND